VVCLYKVSYSTPRSFSLNEAHTTRTAFSEVSNTNRLTLPGAAPFSARQLASSMRGFQKVLHGLHDRLDSARQLCLAYPKTLFCGCPACALDGFSPDELVDGKPPIVVSSDANFKLWIYKFNAGLRRGFFRWFRGEVDDLVQDEERGVQPPLPTAARGDADADLCDRQFEALNERAKAGSKIQASCCMGATCCAHGLCGRGSVVYARSGAHLFPVICRARRI
jgi:hypothetical protein